MTNEQILNAIDEYRRLFEHYGFVKEDHSHGEKVNDYERPDGALNHCYGMLDSMVVFVQEGKIDKAFRWLGFIQGVLWARGFYSLDSLKEHNR